MRLLVLMFCVLFFTHNPSADQHLTDVSKKQAELRGEELLAHAQRMLIEKRPVSAFLLAGRAIGFTGFGGPFTDYQVLLSPDSKAFRNALDLIRQNPFPLVWQSPTLYHTVPGDHASRSVGISYLEFSPDGMILASAGDNRFVHLWDPKTGRKTATIRAQGDKIYGLKFTWDGHLVLAVADPRTHNGSLEFWDVKSQRINTIVPVPHGAIEDLTISENNRHLATHGREYINVWSISNKKLKARFREYPFLPKSIALSPDGTSLVAGDMYGSIKVWDVEQNKLVATVTSESSGFIRYITYSPNGQLLAASVEEDVVIWSVQTGDILRRLTEHNNSVWETVFTHDSRLFISSSDDDTLRLWDIATGETIAILKGHWGIARVLALNPDNNLLASAGGWDNTIRLWSVSERKAYATVSAHCSFIDSIAFSPAGDCIASAGGSDGTVHVWSATNGAHLAELRRHDGGDAGEISYSNSGTMIAVAGRHDHPAVLWNLSKGQLIATLGDSPNSWSTAFSPEDKFIAVGCTGAIEIFDAQSHIRIARLEAHRGACVKSVSFSPNGHILATAGQDKLMNLWDLNSKTILHTLRGNDGWVNGAVFSTDGKTLWSWSNDGGIRLWDATTGKSLRMLDKHDMADRVLKIIPNINLAISAGTDSTLRLWDLTTGKLERILEGHFAPPTSVAVTDGGRSITSSCGRTIVIWNLSNTRRLIPERYLEQLRFENNQVTFSIPTPNLYGSNEIVFPPKH